MQANKVILSATILLTTVSVCIASYVLMNEKNIGYVDAVRLFNEYQMKRDLEGKDELQLKLLRDKIDSLKGIYDVASKEAKVDEKILNEIEAQGQYLNRAFEQEYTLSNRNINEQVWKRLNPIIDEFARKEKIDILMGANGMGTVLFGSKETDHTDELIKYVNDKYASGEK